MADQDDLPQDRQPKEEHIPKPGQQFTKDKKTYVVCDTGKCWKKIHEKTRQVSCWTGADMAHKCQDPCSCMLLRASTQDQTPKWEPVPDNDKQGKDKDGYDVYPFLPKSYIYWCVCVKPL